MAKEEVVNSAVGPLAYPPQTSHDKHIDSQRLMAYNVYSHFNLGNSKVALITVTSKQVGFGEKTIRNTVKLMETSGSI